MFAHDKKLHAGAGFVIAWLAGMGVLSLGWPLWLALVPSVVAGAGKEAWDACGHGDPDIWDFAATVAGGVLALIVLSVVRAVS